jgi:hypothetical protein
MSNNRRASITAILLIAAIGLIWTGAAKAADSPLHTVGVASTCGNTFSLLHAGTFGFSNTNDHAAVPDWQIDGMITAAVSKALAGRYNVTQLHLEPADIVRDPAGFISFFKPDPAHLRTALEKNGSFDEYVVVIAGPEADAIGGKGFELSGIGLYQQSQLGDLQLPDLFTACRAYLVDGRTFETVDQELLAVPRQDNSVHGILAAVSALDSKVFYTVVTDAAWANTVSALTPQQKQIILNALSDLLDREMPPTLQKLKLVP